MLTPCTSESVTEGHPDKVADQVADSILDAVLDQDPTGRVACEILLKGDLAVIAGEIRTDAGVDAEAVLRSVVRDIGYDDAEVGFDADGCRVLVQLSQQSPEISEAIDHSNHGRLGRREVDPRSAQGAGDQGMMFGFACTDTDVLMPLPIWCAHELAKRLAQVRKDGTLPYLRPDGKTQVSFTLEDGEPRELINVLISAQHVPGVDFEAMQEDIARTVVTPVIPERFADDGYALLINPSGSFERGGPLADTGLTGRKIIVDTYGGAARHGGGAFSGKDPSKVDRSGAYAARWIAKHVVASGAARRCEIQVAYAIGHSDPTSVFVETFGTEEVGLATIHRAIETVFDLRPAAIIESLNLLRPIYRPTATYGHFGREDLAAPWEALSQLAEFSSALGS